MKSGQENAIVLTEELQLERVPNCLLCGQVGLPLYEGLHDRSHGVPGRWGLLRCPSCGLIWLNPRPTESEVNKVYASYYTHSVPVDASKLSELRANVRRLLIAHRFNYGDLRGGLLEGVVAWMIGLLPPFNERVGNSIVWLEGSWRGQLLDVGCGSGSFLARMRDLGWQVTGVEPDEKAASLARDNYGLTVFQTTLGKSGLSDDSFDAVTLNHVIEHVHDPVGLLRQCSLVSKRNARIVVVTPNVWGLAHKLLKQAWCPPDPPRHIYNFSPHTLRVCAETAGLHVESLRTTACAADWIWPSSRLIQRNGSLPGGSLGEIGFWLRIETRGFELLEHMSRAFNSSLGEEIVMVCRPDVAVTKQRPVE